MSFDAHVEADEPYMAGKERNKYVTKKLQIKRGPVGKTPGASIKNRATGQVVAKAVQNVDAATLPGFVTDHTAKGTQVYTDEPTNNHSVGEYVHDMPHTSGLESFWALLKVTFHKINPKDLSHYVNKSSGHHNVHGRDYVDQMIEIMSVMYGKRLKYQDLIKDNSLNSGMRS